jgi:hypothetical protein
MSISFASLRHVSTSVVAIVLALQFSGDAHALNPFGSGNRDSTALINARKAQGPLSNGELAVILLADPPISAISKKTIVMGYDPARYLFRPERSGLLCAFADGASCPPPSAIHGSVLVSSLPVVPELQFGTPRANSTLQVQNDDANGVVSVVFETTEPLVFDTPGDQNWFAFYFEALAPYDPYQTLVTFHDQPGRYDFTQISASCALGPDDVPCGSDVPGFGVSLTPVPEPAALAMWLSGLGAITAWRLRARHSSSGLVRVRARAG